MATEDTTPDVRELADAIQGADAITAVRVSVLDLTAKQVQAIERILRLPFAKWQDAPSTMQLLMLVAAAGSGRPAEDFAGCTLRDLNRMVTLDGETDPDS